MDKSTGDERHEDKSERIADKASVEKGASKSRTKPTFFFRFMKFLDTIFSNIAGL